ncbi:uncharacterized protein LOC135112940 isoform X2 [Scylla paramamosain]|uniref:uncharacterized protein LOC135112940 isoform X2 n=1 Tax=Scylla paramamosain TaxID=85552 RepID=UPI0030839A7A
MVHNNSSPARDSNQQPSSSALPWCDGQLVPARVLLNFCAFPRRSGAPCVSRRKASPHTAVVTESSSLPRVCWSAQGTHLLCHLESLSKPGTSLECLGSEAAVERLWRGAFCAALVVVLYGRQSHKQLPVTVNVDEMSRDKRWRQESRCYELSPNLQAT